MSCILSLLLSLPLLLTFPLTCVCTCSPNSFLLNVNGSEVYLCTDTPKQLQGWLNALRPVCGASHVGEPIVADRVSHLVKYDSDVPL